MLLLRKCSADPPFVSLADVRANSVFIPEGALPIEHVLALTQVSLHSKMSNSNFQFQA